LKSYEKILPEESNQIKFICHKFSTQQNGQIYHQKSRMFNGQTTDVRHLNFRMAGPPLLNFLNMSLYKRMFCVQIVMMWRTRLFAVYCSITWSQSLKL